MEIKKKDLEGEPENVCTSYNVHTISLVKTNALGVNILRAKSEGDPETEEINILKDKIEKAKAKDKIEGEAEQANLDIIEKAKAAEDKETEVVVEETETSVDDKSKAEDEVKEVEEIEKAKSEDTEIVADVEVVEDVEKAKSEDAPEEEEVKEVEEIEKAKAEDTDSEVTISEDEVKEKAKSFSIEELGAAQKTALELVGVVFRKVKEAAPDANPWEVFRIIENAVYDVDDILIEERAILENKIWDEVSAQVAVLMEKSKSLKVKEATTTTDAIKALEAINPEMAKILSAEMVSNKAKAADAVADKEAVIRQKALEKGSQMYKRMACEGNTTDNIVDALSTIELASPEAHTVVSKALSVASNILQAGELFPDVGTSMEAQLPQGEASYLEEKSKALVTAAEEKGETMHLAAARANVRQSEEYTSQYG